MPALRRYPHQESKFLALGSWVRLLSTLILSILHSFV